MYAVSTALENLAAVITTLPQYSTDTHCLGTDSLFTMGSESAVIAWSYRSVAHLWINSARVLRINWLESEHPSLEQHEIHRAFYCRPSLRISAVAFPTSS